jgi:hypothetical protein
MSSNEIAAMGIILFIILLIIFSVVVRKRTENQYKNIAKKLGLNKINVTPTLTGYNPEYQREYDGFNLSVGYYINPAHFNYGEGTDTGTTSYFAIEVKLKTNVKIPKLELSRKNAVTETIGKIGITTKTGDKAFDERFYIPGKISYETLQYLLSPKVRYYFLQMPVSFMFFFNRKEEKTPSLLFVLSEGGLNTGLKINLQQVGEVVDNLIKICNELESTDE